MGVTVDTPPLPRRSAPSAVDSTCYRFLERREALGDAAPGCVNDRVGLAVERFPPGQDAAQIFHRLGVVGHRPYIALRDDAAHVLLGRGLEPYREAGGEQQVEGAGLRDETAAGRDDGPRMALENRLEA